MKNDLPYLNQARLNCIFDHVYDSVGISEGKAIFENERLVDFFEMLKSMQNFTLATAQTTLTRFSICSTSAFSILSVILRAQHYGWH